MNLTDDEICGVAARVWSNLFGLPVCVDPAGEGPIAVPVTGWLHFSGEVPGALFVAMPMVFAKQLSGLLFGMDASSPSTLEVSDVVAELTNILGGNLKGALSGIRTMSLPEVRYGDFSIADLLPGAEVQSRVSMRCAGEALTITYFVR